MAELPQSLMKAPAERGRVSREVLSAQQREKILDAAIEVFAKRGFQAAPVESIVASAQVGVGSFYAHFDGKEQCLLAVAEKISAEVSTRIAAATADGEGWAERLCDGLYASLSFVVEKPLSARVMLLELQTGGAESLARYGAGLERLAAFLREGREVGAPDPEPPPSFEEATASGLLWLMQGRLARGEIDAVGPLFAEMAEVALEPYIGAVETRRQIRAAEARAA